MSEKSSTSRNAKIVTAGLIIATGASTFGAVPAAVSYTHLTLPTNREV